MRASGSLVRYDLGAAMTKEAVARRAPTIWRCRELLPVADESRITSLGEGMSPLLNCDRLGAPLGLNDLRVRTVAAAHGIGYWVTLRVTIHQWGVRVPRAHRVGARTRRTTTVGPRPRGSASSAAHGGSQS